MSVFSLAKADIEHIYPQTPEHGHEDPALEKVKRNLGNLAFLYQGDNRRYKNKPFAVKQVKAYKSSESALTSDLASRRKWPRWTTSQVKRRQSELVDLAVAVFGPF